MAVSAVFTFALLWNGFVHGVLLRDMSLALESVTRPATQRSLVLGLALTAGVAIMFVFSYATWVHTPGLRRAVGHGVFFALLAGLFVDLNQFILYPIPGSLAAAWFGFGLIEFCFYGLLVWWLYPVTATGDRAP
jgi:hypothetical protein